jgi:glycolate oxidase iron-sulfur subunit
MYVKLHSDFAGDALAREAGDIIKSCVHCGFCNATCPTYQEIFDERDGPRGRVYLVKHMLESGQAGDVTRMHLDRCLTCRACETTCPSGVRYGRLADIGREMNVFPYPARVRAMMTAGRMVRWLLPPHLRRQVPPRQPLTERQTIPRVTQRKMIILSGCVQSAATPQTNDAARRVLRRVGIELIDAPSAGCCGAVSYHLAAREEALG